MLIVDLSLNVRQGKKNSIIFIILTKYNDISKKLEGGKRERIKEAHGLLPKK